MVDNVFVSPDTLTLWRALLIYLTAETGNLRTEAAIDCLRAISDGMINVECIHEF
jgi:hypothetical protein